MDILVNWSYFTTVCVLLVEGKLGLANHWITFRNGFKAFVGMF